jgi:transcription antitermination factor NusG
MTNDNKYIKWYVLLATNGRAEKFCNYLKFAEIEYFYPMYYQERRIRNSKLRTKQILQPIFRYLLFVKSTKSKLNPILKKIGLDFGITSDLYLRYWDEDERKIVVVPSVQMRHFMTVVGAVEEPIIYLSNEEVDLAKGTRVQITGGTFEGVEGIFMKIKGSSRVVVSLPNLLSVATAFIPTRFIQPIK